MSNNRDVRHVFQGLLHKSSASLNFNNPCHQTLKSILFFVHLNVAGVIFFFLPRIQKSQSAVRTRKYLGWVLKCREENPGNSLQMAMGTLLCNLPLLMV